MAQVEFDTSSLTKQERLDAWSETISGAFGPFAIADNDPERFHGRVKVERRHDIRFIGLGYSGHGFVRRPSDVSRLDDAYYSLMRPIRGRLRLVQDGVTRLLEPGHFYVVNHSLPYRTTPEDGYVTEAVAFPPAALEARVARPQPFYALKDDPACQRSALLGTYLQHFAGGRDVWSDREFERLSGQLIDLVVLSIVEPGTAAAAGETSARAAHRERAMRHIRSHLGERDLSARTVAAACGISLAYLHEIFRAAGSGVEETIFAERLERARIMLTAPEHAGQHIATIAYRLGFSDPAHFARAFRRRFGLSPRDTRR